MRLFKTCGIPLLAGMLFFNVGGAVAQQTTELQGSAEVDAVAQLKPPIPEQTNPPKAESLFLVQDANGKWVLPAGSTFNVTVNDTISSGSAGFGNQVKATLAQDIYAGDRRIASAGDQVIGVIKAVDRSRFGLKAKVSPERWLNADAGISLEFDFIVSADGAHIEIDALPYAGSRITRCKPHEVALLVNKEGDIVPEGIGKKERGVGLAVTGLNFGVSPFAGMALSAAAGAVDPKYALGNATLNRTEHPRIKGFVYGAVEGAPGVGIARAVINHGTDVVLNPGDSIKVQLAQNMTWTH